MASEESPSAFYDEFCQLIENTRKVIDSTTHKFRPLHGDMANYVEGAFYSNLIRLYKKNLNVKYFRKVKMSKDDRVMLWNLLKPYFKRADESYDNVYNKGEVDFHVYQDFRSTIFDFGSDAYWLLLGVERYADIITCEHRLIQFKVEMESLIGEGGGE